jgi:hypothetical protein
MEGYGDYVGHPQSRREFTGGLIMTGKSVTRLDLYEVVYRTVGLFRAEAG